MEEDITFFLEFLCPFQHFLNVPSLVRFENCSHQYSTSIKEHSCIRVLLLVPIHHMTLFMNILSLFEERGNQFRSLPVSHDYFPETTGFLQAKSRAYETPSPNL